VRDGVYSRLRVLAIGVAMTKTHLRPLALRSRKVSRGSKQITADQNR